MTASLGYTMSRHAVELLLVLALLAPSCTPKEHAIEPYRSDPVAARALEARATAACLRPATALPTHSFTTDGCSMFPDSVWGTCCVEHDIEYWCGGSSEDREHADELLRECVSEKASTALGWLMYAGVRFGGVPWSPFPWRWGYGWDWYRGYDPRGR